MADGEQFKKPKKNAAAPTFNAILELAPPAQKPLLLGYFIEAANAKTSNEFFGAIDKIADMLRLRKNPAQSAEEAFATMFGFSRGQAHNTFGFDYNHNADTVKNAFATKGFNCLSGNLIMAKLVEETLKANEKLDGSISMRLVIGTLASFSGGHVIAKAEIGGQTRYYDMANTTEKGTVIRPTKGNRAESSSRYQYFLGKEFTINETERYASVQQTIRDRTGKWGNATEKDFVGVPVELLPYALRLIDREDAMAILSRLGYETPADLTTKIKDNETRISIALYLLDGYLKQGETNAARIMAKFIAESFNVPFDELNKMKVSHQIGSICRAYDIMKENGDAEATTILYKIILFAGAMRPIASIDDAQEIVKRIEKAEAVEGSWRFAEILSINAALEVLPAQGTEEFNVFAMQRLMKRFYVDMQKEGINVEKIIAVNQETRRVALNQLFFITMGLYAAVEWNPLQRHILLNAFIEPNSALMEKYHEYSKTK